MRLIRGGGVSGIPKLYVKFWQPLFLALKTRLFWPKVTFEFINIPIDAFVVKCAKYAKYAEYAGHIKYAKYVKCAKFENMQNINQIG